MPNGIDLVLADHRKVDALFTKFNETRLGSYAGMIFDSLAAHDDAENGALYPLALGLLGDAELLDRAEAAHSQVKKLIDHAKTSRAPLADDGALQARRAHVRTRREPPPRSVAASPDSSRVSPRDGADRNASVRTQYAVT
jgi:hypothetical protein